MPENIVPGALVFDKDLEIYGVVMRVQPGQVQVYLDTNQTKNFSDLSRIERVQFGQRVQQLNPKRSGFKLAQVSDDPPVWKMRS